MESSRLHREQKAPKPWPIPRLVDDAIRNKPSLRSLVQVSSHLYPNLSRGIHPVFSHKNFPALSKDAYCNLSLALRLATRLLKAPHLLPWWIHVAFGTRTHKGKDVEGQNEFFLAKNGEYTQRHAQLTREAINSLSKRVKWSFDIWNGGDFSYARTTFLSNQKARPLHPLFMRSRLQNACEVYLHDDFRSFAEHGFLDASLEERLRFSFAFAATIVHELTHCFAALRRGFLKPEEFFDIDDPACELGWSWETWAFGGVILACDQKISPPGHLVWNTWVDETNKKTSRGYCRQLLPMDWIAGWFREETWGGQAPRCVLQDDMVFWESSRTKVKLFERGSELRSKRSFTKLCDPDEKYEEEEEEEETLAVQQSKRPCCRL